MRKYMVVALALLTAGCSTFYGDAQLNTLLEQKRITGVSIKCLPPVIKSELVLLATRYGKIEVVSAHRPGALIAGTRQKSYHASCRAVDFHIIGKGSRQDALRYLKKTWNGGLGTYSGCMHHYHLDNGRRLRYHHKVNCNGRKVR